MCCRAPICFQARSGKTSATAGWTPPTRKCCAPPRPSAPTRWWKSWKTGLTASSARGGDRLSTGEKQLISFARAVLADPAIFVLDEATSSIDTRTEQLIQAAISHLLQGRTSFVIAHRLSTIRHADLILVVKDGKIIERGRHEELLRMKGYYHTLYSRQFAEESAMGLLKAE
ncbi:ATP-binding cassette domain-containing protein [Caproicibacter fermentans]|uniref:ATP-binding cassette domain-containing protein n=1 Tax=Caproicibacter fermentans TaxID=2576756 RepID=UPI0038B3349C